MEKVSEVRKKFLRYIDTTYKPRVVYYPACGADGIPKEVFGAERVVHLSLPENEPTDHYLERLGEGIKLLGDMENSPLADESVDLIWLNLHGIRLSEKTLADFGRVLKKGGLIAIEELHRNKREEWDQLVVMFRNFQQIELPVEFQAGSVRYGIVKDLDEEGKYQGEIVEGQYVDSEKEMVDLVTSHREYRGFENILDQAMFEKIE